MKDFLPIGTYVQCGGRIVAKKGPRNRTLVRRDGFVEGFIVGGSFLKEGLIDFDSEDGYSFIQTKSVFVYKVIRGFINKPVFVLPEQIAYQSFPEKPGTCSFISIKHDEKDMAYLSGIMKDEMKDHPRDSKGRWIKKITPPPPTKGA